jgi:hypothetical protein
MNVSTDQVIARFVILFHRVSDGQTLAQAVKDEIRRTDHWDLMFECGGQLLTWAVATEPFKSGFYEAIQLPNHRLEYLTYEGPISANRGEVQQSMAGTFCIDCNDVAATDLTEYRSAGQFELRLFSDEMKRKISFQRESGLRWTLTMTAETR